jgi:hypothetical protein
MGTAAWARFLGRVDERCGDETDEDDDRTEKQRCSHGDTPPRDELNGSPPNDIEFSGERKRVRCNEGLEGAHGRREGRDCRGSLARRRLQEQMRAGDGYGVELRGDALDEA